MDEELLNLIAWVGEVLMVSPTDFIKLSEGR